MARQEPYSGPYLGGAIKVVDVFNLDRALVADYASFARTFTQIRARDIRDQVDTIYASRRFWPEPLISINPHYEPDSPSETFRVLKKNEKACYGGYRTARLGLAAWDAQEAQLAAAL
jgi:hypothetical protein